MCSLPRRHVLKTVESGRSAGQLLESEMFNVRGRFVLLLLSICIFAWGAHAIVVNGPAGSGTTAGWDGVGTLIPQQSGFSPITATLIDSTHLLTSGHGVYNVANQAPVANNVFDFQLDGVNYELQGRNFSRGHGLPTWGWLRLD